MENFVSVGYTKKTHGIKGQLKVKINEQFIEDFLQAEVLFIEIHGKRVPFFVEHKDIGNSLLLKLEDVESKEAAVAITSKEIFLREADIIPEEERQFEVEGLEFEKFRGYTIFDEIIGKVGKIEEIVEYPQQEMAIVNYRGKEKLIPMNDELIVEENAKKKMLMMSLPEGLLSL